MRTWFVTGASRGLGAELVRQIAARGDRVVATARNASVVTEAFGALERVHATALDVTDPAAALRAVGEAVEVFGGIDIVVNNAGYGLSGAIEETSDAEARALF